MSYKSASSMVSIFIDSPLAARYNPLSHSCVAQRQSIRLLTGGLLVRIQPQEFVVINPVTNTGCDNRRQFLAMLQFEQRKQLAGLLLSLVDDLV